MEFTPKQRFLIGRISFVLINNCIQFVTFSKKSSKIILLLIFELLFKILIFTFFSANFIENYQNQIQKWENTSEDNCNLVVNAVNNNAYKGNFRNKTKIQLTKKNY